MINQLPTKAPALHMRCHKQATDFGANHGDEPDNTAIFRDDPGLRIWEIKVAHFLANLVFDGFGSKGVGNFICGVPNGNQGGGVTWCVFAYHRLLSSGIDRMCHLRRR